ncbi:MAG: sulfur oxidation c-type cytochrome SoxA [Gammaproteobacteria bacterium]|nr:sulfur oxidation c-type cytochrome SoxA [Gammaproteobacteria bacterium]
MRKLLTIAMTFGLAVSTVYSTTVLADAEADRKAFKDYFVKKFPETDPNDFINGVYSIDKASRAQWEEIEEFPPYEIAIDSGESEWNKSFANGKGYKDCFGKAGVADQYPQWDDGKGKVVTLALAINDCREANGEKPLKYKKGKMADLLAYMGYQTRGKKVNVKIPNAKAQEAYDKGKQFYYARRGQLNMACAHCHVDNSGMRIRADLLSPALGHTTHFPVYRSKWGGMGTLHRRFAGCNKQVRAKPFKAQSEEYRNLEYFLTFMSNGLDVNAPGARK